jgi:hypothetical protein
MCPTSKIRATATARRDGRYESNGVAVIDKTCRLVGEVGLFMLLFIFKR